MRSDGGRGGEGVGVVARGERRREEGGEGEQEIEEEEEEGREGGEGGRRKRWKGQQGEGELLMKGGTRLQRGRRNSGTNKIGGEKIHNKSETWTIEEDQSFFLLTATFIASTVLSIHLFMGLFPHF